MKRNKMTSITSIIPSKNIIIVSASAFTLGYFFPVLTTLLCSFAIGKELAQNKKNKTAQKLEEEFYSRQERLNND